MGNASIESMSASIRDPNMLPPSHAQYVPTDLRCPTSKSHAPSNASLDPNHVNNPIIKLHSAASDRSNSEYHQDQYGSQRGHAPFPHRSSSLANSLSSSTSPTFSLTQASTASTASSATTASESDSDDAQVYSIREISWLEDGSRPGSVCGSTSPFVDSCQLDTNDWFAQFDHNIDVTDEPPSDEAIWRAARVPIYDGSGNSRSFNSLFTNPNEAGDRQLIIFIRHFFCGACKAYITRLVEQINLETYFNMEIATSIVVIGCGSPELIHQYKQATKCPFPIFADPTRQLFKLLGMHVSFNMLGPGRPDYMRDISAPKWVVEQSKVQIKAKGLSKFRGGNILQIGGEFLFEEGKVTWCHRMPNYRGHAEVATIKRVLGIN